jgi:hypothetical protein
MDAALFATPEHRVTTTKTHRNSATRHWRARRRRGPLARRARDQPRRGKLARVLGLTEVDYVEASLAGVD